MQRKDAGARAAVHLIEQADQLLELERLAVLVEAEVGVGVDHPARVRKQLAQLGVERRKGRRQGLHHHAAHAPITLAR